MTRIEWTEETWNPVGGCRKVSPECANCYAIRQAHRMAGNPNPKIAGRYKGLTQITNGVPNWTGETFIDEEVLLAPLKRKKPTTYFISLSDLFFDKRQDADIDRVFAVMALAHWHTFQILTKYDARMLEYHLEEEEATARIHAEMSYIIDELVDVNERRSDDLRATAPDVYGDDWPLPNLWLGVSVGLREQKHRIDALRHAPAALRFLSLEPLLEDLGTLDLAGISWVIVGGESGPGARPMHPDWARSVRDQCIAVKVPFFFKQHGEWIHMSQQDRSPEYPLVVADGANGCPEGGYPSNRCHAWPDWSQSYHCGKRNAGRLLDGREWNELPEVPHA